MIQLYDKDTNERIGSITEDNLRFLVDQLEEESGTIRTTISLRLRSIYSRKAARIRL
jgi:hypothetical protein